MRGRCFVLFLWFLAFGPVVISLPALAAKPSFTVSATNVTMPRNGDGSIPFVLSSVDGYVGSVTVQCPEVNAPVGAKVPYCGGGPVLAFDLTPNEAVNGKLVLTPYGMAVPLATGAVLAGLSMRRRRRAGWATLAVVLTGALASLGEFAGCGSGSSGMTPGTYSYTVTATDTQMNAVSTTVNVTVL